MQRAAVKHQRVFVSVIHPMRPDVKDQLAKQKDQGCYFEEEEQRWNEK